MSNNNWKDMFNKKPKVLYSEDSDEVLKLKQMVADHESAKVSSDPIVVEPILPDDEEPSSD